MIISGKNSVREALRSGATVEKLYVEKGNFDRAVNEIIKLAKESGINVVFSDKQVMDKLAEGKHQGVAAVTTEFAYAELSDVLALAKSRGEEPLVVVLDGVQDPHNLGAVIRSAECLGAHGVVIGKHRAVGVTETVVKASAGATAHLPVVKVTNVNDAIRELKEHFLTVYCADMDGKPLESAKFQGGTVIVVGGEGEGVKRLTKELCDEVLAIPQRGKVNSLNASVACGIMLYAVAASRK